MSAPPASPDDVFVSAKAGRAFADWTLYTLMRFALLGRVRYRVRPGEPIRYHKGDIGRVRDEETGQTPAPQSSPVA